MAKDTLSYENPFDDFPDDLPEDLSNNDDAPLMLDKRDDDIFDNDDDNDDDDDYHFSNEVDDIDVHTGDESMVDQETTTLDYNEWMASDQVLDCERSCSPTLGTDLYRRIHPDDSVASQSNSERHAQLCGMTGGLDQVLNESFNLGDKFRQSTSFPVPSSKAPSRPQQRPQALPTGNKPKAHNPLRLTHLALCIFSNIATRSLSYPNSRRALKNRAQALQMRLILRMPRRSVGY
ncbi:MAG: hypothetical protein J3Q66DRAFT_374929 [Benniella sp.]|nr:MAG: hypothetical protein J3Q66DRAFT_374929 [Benniella sp.]